MCVLHVSEKILQNQMYTTTLKSWCLSTGKAPFSFLSIYNLLHVSVFINSSVKFTNNFFNNNIAWKVSWQSFYCLCFPTLAYNTVHTNIAIFSSLKIYSMIFKIHETISCQLIIPVWFNFIVYDNYSLLISRKI